MIARGQEMCTAELELWLQRVLEIIYRIDGPLDVADYRIDERHLDVLLGPERRSPHESLLVEHGEDCTWVALFIEEAVRLRARLFLDSVATASPFDLPIDDFCVTAEGVSHFLYFTFCGERLDRPVSEVELEIQAEIDKFLVMRLMLPLPGTELLSRLFDRFDLLPNLGKEHVARYREANRLGRRYARWLERRMRAGKTAEALDDARRLYRKPLAAKLEHIECAT